MAVVSEVPAPRPTLTAGPPTTAARSRQATVKPGRSGLGSRWNSGSGALVSQYRATRSASARVRWSSPMRTLRVALCQWPIVASSWTSSWMAFSSAAPGSVCVAVPGGHRRVQPRFAFPGVVADQRRLRGHEQVLAAGQRGHPPPAQRRRRVGPLEREAVGAELVVVEEVGREHRRTGWLRDRRYLEPVVHRERVVRVPLYRLGQAADHRVGRGEARRADVVGAAHAGVAADAGHQTGQRADDPPRQGRRGRAWVAAARSQVNGHRATP